jgi:hypothetical protein
VAAYSSYARRAVKVASAAADRLRPHVEGVVILLYHRVGGGSSLEIDLDAARFDDQIAQVASRGAGSLGGALEQLVSTAPVAGDPSVVVTFDDGTADFVEVALPVLVRHQVPATLYLATDFVEGGNTTPAGARTISWSALRDACATGLVNIGSHTHSSSIARSISSASTWVRPRTTSRIRRRLPEPPRSRHWCTTASARPRSPGRASIRIGAATASTRRICIVSRVRRSR